ncbi:gamma-glutamylcyclotransferase family protein [Streptomyces abikoensis]|uniref:Putative gamma-glutamylcyclotransferase n=1 Tax=Streptomyces abikoensis TaxID=97398 RepID=A0ABW7T6R6_9ACTN
MPIPTADIAAELAHHPTDRLASNPDALFVYGTLQFPEVLQALLGRIPASTPARAAGWRAAALANRVYPGLVRSTELATGLLLDDLAPTEWRALDDFEDDHYNLHRISLDSGRHGWAYVWPAEDVLPYNWSARAFQAEHLTAYATRCAGIAARRIPRAS